LSEQSLLPKTKRIFLIKEFLRGGGISALAMLARIKVGEGWAIRRRRFFMRPMRDLPGAFWRAVVQRLRARLPPIKPV
jgi:hypothetical protein